MRSTENLAKRLAEVERQRGHGTANVTVDYCSRTAACEQILTDLPPDDPHVVELHWSDKRPADDAEKIRWLMQYTPAQLAELRSVWEASSSTHKRAKAALKELDRLMYMLKRLEQSG